MYHAGGGGVMVACVPNFFKSEKVPFFLGKSAPFKERKKYFLNERPLLLERKCLFCSSKDSVKAIFHVIEIPYFQKFFVRLVNDIKSFDFDHIQKRTFWPMPLQFRNASATSGTMQNKLNRENHFQSNIIGIAATTNFLPISMCLISELVFAGLNVPGYWHTTERDTFRKVMKTKSMSPALKVRLSLKKLYFDANFMILDAYALSCLVWKAEVPYLISVIAISTRKQL